MLKSPYSVGHSRAVSALAAEAARRCDLPESDAIDLGRAGLLNDIGQVAVPARIWLKAAAFNDGDWEQVRLHTYYGERVLARPAALARLGAIVAQHHERCDGSGYHRGARAPTLSVQGRILGVAGENEWLHVFTCRDGRVVEWRGYDDTAQLALAYRSAPAQGAARAAG